MCHRVRRHRSSRAIASLVLAVGLVAAVRPLAAETCDTQVIETGVAFHVIIDDATKLGGPIDIGDHVRLYDEYEGSKIIVGFTAYDGSSPLHVVAWQRDDALGLPGFTPGHAIEIRLCHRAGTMELEGHPEPLDEATYGEGDALQLSSVAFLVHEPPPAPILTEPPDGTACLGTNVILRWLPVPDTIVYTIQLGLSCGVGEERQAAFPEITWQSLATGTTYFWRVKATDSFGAEGPYSECFSFRTDPGEPGLTTLLEPPDGTTGQSIDGTLEWTEVPDATGYDVQIGTACGSGPIVATASTSHDYSGLDPLTTYHWRVRALAECDDPGAWTSCFTFTTAAIVVPPPLPLAPPDGATCVADAVELEWSAVPGAVEYTVLLGSACTDGEERTTTDTTLVWNDLQPSAIYFWRVRVTVTGGAQSSYSSCSSFTTGPAPPGVPVLVSPADGATDQPVAGVLDWLDVSGASAYRVQLGTVCGAGPENLVTDSGFAYSGLAHDTTYHWRVQARNTCGFDGVYSACFSFTTAMSPDTVGVVLRNGEGGYLGTEDNVMIDLRPQDNWGGGPELAVGAHNVTFDITDIQRSLVRFDLSAIEPSAFVVSASLRMYNHETESQEALEIGAYRLVKRWVEGTRSAVPQPESGASCWDAARLGELSWSAPGASAASDLAVNNDPDFDRAATPVDVVTLGAAGQWYAWDLTEATRHWVAGDWQNDGVLLQALEETGSNQRSFRSSATTLDPTQRPSLVIQYVPGPNVAPVADPGGPYESNVIVPVHFDGTGSYDPDGTIVTYAWDFGDGATGSGPQPTHVFPAGGDYLIRLTVVDDEGLASDEATTVAHIRQAHTTILRNTLVGYSGGEDNTMIDTRPGDNFGGAGHIGIGTYNGAPDISFTHRALIRFNLTPIPGGSTIIEARLVLYNHLAEGSAPVEIAAYRVVKAWGEGSRSGPPEPEDGASCWNEAALHHLPWSLPGASAASDLAVNGDPLHDRMETPEDTVVLGPVDAWYEWDVTRAVQQWITGDWDNDGLLLEALVEAGTNARRFHSSEYMADESLRPGLIVTYDTGAAGVGAAAGTPALTRVVGAFPNPFARSTTVRYELAAPAHVALRIYDAGGRLVRVLADDAQPAGRHEIAWDGTLGRGERVPRGVYFFRFESGAMRETGKLLNLR